MPSGPLGSWAHQLPRIDAQQMEGPESWEEGEVDALAQQRDDELATSVPPAEWYAKWQEDKAKWELEREEWQQKHPRCRSSVSSSTTPLPAPEPALISPAQSAADEPHAGRRGRLWERLSRRPPWKVVSHSTVHSENDHHSHCTENDGKHVPTPPIAAYGQQTR